MRDIMHNAIEQAGLQPPRKGEPLDRDVRSLHGLRYTFAIRAIEARLDHSTIEAIVGHKTLAMAIKYTEKRRKARLGGAALNAALRDQGEGGLANEAQQLPPADAE
jgi:integrase